MQQTLPIAKTEWKVGQLVKCKDNQEIWRIEKITPNMWGGAGVVSLELVSWCITRLYVYLPIFETDYELYNPLNVDQIECNHEYKKYQGFTQTYDYCVKCDRKVYPYD